MANAITFNKVPSDQNPGFDQVLNINITNKNLVNQLTQKDQQNIADLNLGAYEGSLRWTQPQSATDTDLAALKADIDVGNKELKEGIAKVDLSLIHI